MAKIEKDTVLEIDHKRKGNIAIIALQDFDTSDGFWPVAVAQEIPVFGMSTRWQAGEQISCRGDFVKSYKVIEPTEE